MPDTFILQPCGEGRNARQTLGVIATSEGGLANVQSALRSWSHATCVEGDLETTSIQLTVAYADRSSVIHRDTALHNGLDGLEKRAECSTISVEYGDSCTSLAKRCGITGAKFTDFNSYDSDLCSTLDPRQHA
ncbi:LysM peptidoglycan-binding domain-containing protein [Aspergillus lucknowensis]|uniref:LysM domain-containing protein n=1 Tax=Aspergillus lucknowensis TaxID=176173 RepID=A0ABR4LZA4_9EURO